MNRPTIYRRKQRQRHIARRKMICHHYTAHLANGVDAPMEWYEHDGQYDKGKIYCSCYMCRPGKYDGVPNISTVKKLASWKEQLTSVSCSQDDMILAGA